MFQALCEMILNIAFYSISQLYEVGTIIFPILGGETYCCERVSNLPKAPSVFAASKPNPTPSLGLPTM